MFIAKIKKIFDQVNHSSCREDIMPAQVRLCKLSNTSERLVYITLH